MARDVECAAEVVNGDWLNPFPGSDFQLLPISTRELRSVRVGPIVRQLDVGLIEFAERRAA